ncbi:MAG: cell wall metabolism sensor histidine kinase WalK, partial [Actinomycetota bacterium]|nr:cell wall metabolism sensor histidine kinase WalK [Actinomycetota bacterium]
ANEADRLARIVDDILWASQLESGRLQFGIESCDAGAVAAEVVEAARAHLPKGVSIELVLPPSLPEVAGDRDKIRQVLVNLIENAVKYSPEGGTVEVHVEPLERRLRVSVRDEGLGIPLTEQQRIFEKFYRLDPNLTRGVGGTGLGLYICRELVRRMNGRLWVASKEGQGSTFFVELPLAEAVR